MQKYKVIFTLIGGMDHKSGAALERILTYLARLKL
jgi:hypothetical protein